MNSSPPCIVHWAEDQPFCHTPSQFPTMLDTTSLRSTYLLETRAQREVNEQMNKQNKYIIPLLLDKWNNLPEKKHPASSKSLLHDTLLHSLITRTIEIPQLNHSDQ